MNTAATLAILNRNLRPATLQVARENASEGGVTAESYRTQRRIYRATKYLTKRLERATDCQGAGVECQCGRAHGDRHDRGEWMHCA